MPGSEAMIGERYRLVRQLAAGGMGTVWEAWDERLQRRVAIKQLHVQPGLSKHDAEIAVERARREGRLTARLHHPNAVQVFDVVDHEGQPCLVMQYVPSTSLADIVRDRGPLPVADVAQIGTQIAAALAAAHRAGITHRDVKPGNVLIADDGTAKITDFGISHAFDDVSLTSTGMVSGTPAYLAPEVARGIESGYASDVYSLGSTMYMALEGSPPFGTDPNPMALLHKVASGTPTPPSRSGALAPLLHDMMARDPATRPDMVAVANTLGTMRVADGSNATTQFIARPPQPADTTALPAAAAQVRPPAPPVRPPAPPSVPPERWDEREPHRRSWIPVAAAAIVVALAVVLAVVLLSNGGDNTKNAAAPTHSAAARTRSADQPTKSAAAPTKSAPRPKSTPPRTSSSPASNGATASQLANAVDDYYRLVPDNTNEGWKHLTKRFQDNVSQGRGNYEKFWHSIDSVQTSNTSGSQAMTATSTIIYHFKDGRTSTERTQFGLVRDGGILKIDASEVLSSQTN